MREQRAIFKLEQFDNYDNYSRHSLSILLGLYPFERPQYSCLNGFRKTSRHFFEFSSPPIFSVESWWSCLPFALRFSMSHSPWPTNAGGPPPTGKAPMVVGQDWSPPGSLASSPSSSALEARMAQLHIPQATHGGQHQQQHHQQQQLHVQSPVKNYSAFASAGGLFFQPETTTSSNFGMQNTQQQYQHQQHQPQTFQQTTFAQRGPPLSMHSQQPQAQQAFPGLFQQGPQGGNGAPKSILNEVMSMMQPTQRESQAHQPQPLSLHSQPHVHPSLQPHAFPPPPTAQHSQQPMASLRPPMMSMGGPPGFKAPPGFGAPPAMQQQSQQQGRFGGPAPGFPSQQQQQQGAPPGMRGPIGAPMQPPPFAAPTLPAPLQNDSHVQCSLCRVIVVNEPQQLYMHDNSLQHIENERRQQQQRQQTTMPLPAHPPQSSSSPSSAGPSAGPSSLPPGPGQAGFDIASLQARLRDFMIASEAAKARGEQPPQMDPVLMGQLKMVQDAMQQRNQQQQQQGGDEQKDNNGAIGSGGPHRGSGTGVASSVGPFPSRAALIAASSAVNILGPKRLNFKRGPLFQVPINLEFDLRALLDTLKPDPHTFVAREEIRKACEDLVQSAWGAERCEVRLFGSSVNTLCETTSDIDLCLTIRDMDSLSLDKPQIVEKLALLLHPSFARDILALPKARVPIVKFVSVKTGLACDIGINNYLACKNSELIRDYMRLDSRARDMCLLVKHWAKQRKINDPYRGTLSSYCYVMMVIHFLQNELHTSPPVLPCLQTYRRDEATDEEIEREKIEGFDCWYYRDIEKLKGFGEANQQSLGELLVRRHTERRRHARAAATLLLISFVLPLLPSLRSGSFVCTRTSSTSRRRW